MAASATLLAPVARRPTAAAHGRFCQARLMLLLLPVEIEDQTGPASLS